MKQYYTIDYDLNRPTNKIVSAPLNSDFGVGVKMWRDGSALDSDITVGGNASTGTRGGYQLFELSTGSDEAITDYRVSGAYDFNLRVYEINKNYIEKWSGSEPPEPPTELTVLSASAGRFAETTEEIDVGVSLSYEVGNIVLSASQVESFTVTWTENSGEPHTDTSDDHVVITDINGTGWYLDYEEGAKIWRREDGTASASSIAISYDYSSFKYKGFGVEQGNTYEWKFVIEYTGTCQEFQLLEGSSQIIASMGTTNYQSDTIYIEDGITVLGQNVLSFTCQAYDSQDIVYNGSPSIIDSNSVSWSWDSSTGKWSYGMNEQDSITIPPPYYNFDGEFTDLQLDESYSINWTLAYIPQVA